MCYALAFSGKWAKKFMLFDIILFVPGRVMCTMHVIVVSFTNLYFPFSKYKLINVFECKTLHGYWIVFATCCVSNYIRLVAFNQVNQRDDFIKIILVF